MRMWFCASRGNGSCMRVKGQVVFEFVIATLFFLAIVMYAINFLNTTVYQYSGKHYENIYDSNTWQVSENLVRNRGVWNGGLAEELGISGDWPYLNETSISRLQALCFADPDLGDVMRLLDLDPERNGIEMQIYKYLDPGLVNILHCGSMPQGAYNTRITRFGVSDSDGRLLRMTLYFY